MKRIRLSIFAKLVVAFLSVLMPLSAMTLVLNQMGSRSISEEIAKSVKSRDKFYIQSLETELKGISQLILEFVVDKDLQELGISGERIDHFSRTEKVLAVQKRLHMLKASSPYIAETKVFLPQADRTLTSADFMTSIPAGEYAALANNLNAGKVIESEGRLFMSLRYPMNAALERTPVFVVAVELSREQLQSGLLNMVSPEQGNSVLLSLDGSWTVSNERDGRILQTMKAVAGTLAENSQSGGNEERSESASFVLDGTAYMISSGQSPQLGVMLLAYVPEDRILGSLQAYRKWTWLLIVTSVLIVILFAYSLYRIIHHPLRKLVAAFRSVEDGRLVPIEANARRDEFNYLYHRFNSMVSRLDVLIHEVYEKEIRSRRSELKRLQSQINPHFLYNCFFSLNRLIKAADSDKAYRFALYLGEYFRFITRNVEDRIPLGEEMNHARNYVEIQTICYGRRFDVEFDPVDAAYRSLLVPRLIVQPLLENAYKYAFGPSVSHGELWVHTAVADGYLHINVEDNGESMGEAQLAALSARLAASGSGSDETTGLLNVHRRVELMFGPGSGISLSTSQLGGLCVTIRLKLASPEEMPEETSAEEMEDGHVPDDHCG